MADVVTIPVKLTGALKWFDAAAQKPLPDSLQLLKFGPNESVKGPVVLGSVTRQVLARNQHARGFARVAIDYEHNTVPGTPEYERTKEPRAVAGYGDPVLTERGLELLNVEWLPEGKLAAPNFPDLSPAVELSDSGEVLFVHSVALTRNGAVYGCENGAYQTFSVAMKVEANKEKIMDTNNGADVLTVAELATALGLGGADKGAVLGRLKTLSAVQVPDLTPLNTRISGLEQSLAEQRTATESAERGRLVALFAADGKVPKGADGVVFTPEQLAKMDVATLKLLHANAPVTVALSARTAGAGDRKAIDPNLKGRSRMIAAFESAIPAQN